MSEKDDLIAEAQERIEKGEDPDEAISSVTETTQLSHTDIRRERERREAGEDSQFQGYPNLEDVTEQADEIENVEDAIRELAQTDFDQSEESQGRMVQLLKGIAFEGGEDARDLLDQINVATSCWAMENDIAGQENIPDDLIDKCD